MAKRIVFFPTPPGTKELFREELVDFEWVPGLAISQGQKSVLNLHRAAKAFLSIENILEISTRSNSTLGLRLSAFNLQKYIGHNQCSVESIYQSTKVFEFGGPYINLMSESSINAKTDLRLKNSGKLLHFAYEGKIWPLRRSPNLYDLIYISAILEFEQKLELLNFDAFTDIAYSQISLRSNSRRSFNCQARSAAIYVSLANRFPENEIINVLVKFAISQRIQNEQIELFD